jgi:predicted nucleic acid-binding protein
MAWLGICDSDILIWILRGKEEAVAFVRNLVKDEIPGISALAFYEVWAGARPSEEETISTFLSSFEVFSVDEATGKEGARYRRTFRNQRITLSMADALIAATARIHSLILVTQNIRDFPMTDIQKRSL